jgi:hypothetical protein
MEIKGSFNKQFSQSRKKRLRDAEISLFLQIEKEGNRNLNSGLNS